MLIVLIGIMGFIYYMSAQPVVRSGEMSFRIDRLVCRLFVDGFENMTAEQQAAVYDMDFLEYTMLGLILMLTARTFLTSHQKTAALLMQIIRAIRNQRGSSQRLHR